jgi:hypothetical protein
MPCSISSGLQLSGCKGSNVGGVAYIYISPFSASTVVSLDVANDTVSAVTNTTFYKFDLTKQTSSFKDNPSVSIENDVIAYEPEVQLIINRYTATLRNQIKALCQTRVHIIVQDNNGNKILFGKDNGLDLSQGETGSGVKINDRNGSALTFKGLENAPGYFLNSNATFTSSY